MLKIIKSLNYLIATAVFILAMLVSSTFVAAQTDAASKNKMQESQQEFQNKIKEIRQNFTAKRTKAKEDLAAKSKAVKQELEQEKEAARQSLDSARKAAKSKMDELKAKFQQEVSKVKDESKKQIATHLDEQMNQLNVKWTDHFNNVLDQLSAVLAKIKLRTDKAEANGSDVSAVRTAIQNAQNAIDNARTAVQTQAQKSYTATFQSEQQLGSAFKTTRDALHKDLTNLRDNIIKNAREAVKSALQALKGVPKVDEESKGNNTTTTSE